MPWRLLCAGGLLVTISALAVSVAFGAPSRTVVIADADNDVTSPLDITRVSLQRASDGRLRSVLTFAKSVNASTLLATSGPPGSACVRIWTDADADPTAMRPDRLVCVTARSEDALRGGVYDVTGAELPERVAVASVKRNRSGRSLVVRFSQSSLGRPQRIRFAVESTRPGCARASCIDIAPERGAVRVFRPR